MVDEKRDLLTTPVTLGRWSSDCPTMRPLLSPVSCILRNPPTVVCDWSADQCVVPQYVHHVWDSVCPDDDCFVVGTRSGQLSPFECGYLDDSAHSEVVRHYDCGEGKASIGGRDKLSVYLWVHLPSIAIPARNVEWLVVNDIYKGVVRRNEHKRRYLCN